MSNKELTSKIDRLREMRAEIDQKQKKADRLADTIKAEMLRRNVEDNLEIVHRLTPDSPLDDYLVNYEYDIGFHHLLIKCSGNKLLMDLYQFLNPFLYINYVYNKQSKERLLTGIQEHQEIMEHLLNGNEEGARQALTTHLANSKRVIISILKIDHIL